MNDAEKKKHFMNALSNYSGVMNIMGRYKEEARHNPDEPFPENWVEEPLLLLGEYLKYLDMDEGMKEAIRKSTLRLIEECGVQEVWKMRRRLAAETEYILNF